MEHRDYRDIKADVEITEEIDLPCSITECTRHDIWFYGIPDQDFVVYYRKIFWKYDIVYLRGVKEGKPVIKATKFAAKKPLKARGSLSHLINSVNTILRIERGYIGFHAGCVSKDGVTILMPASPNVGKTFTVLYFLNKGYGYLADDSLCVSVKGYAYAHPFPSAVDTHVLERIDLPFIERVKLKIRTFFSKKLPGGTKILRPYLLKAWEAVPGARVIPRARVSHVCILEVGNRGVVKLGVEEAARFIQSINRYSLPRPYDNPVLRAYNMFNPDWMGLKRFEDIEYEKLLELLESTENYLVSSTPRKFGELIEKLIE